MKYILTLILSLFLIENIQSQTYYTYEDYSYESDTIESSSEELFIDYDEYYYSYSSRIRRFYYPVYINGYYNTYYLGYHYSYNPLLSFYWYFGDPYYNWYYSYWKWARRSHHWTHHHHYWGHYHDYYYYYNSYNYGYNNYGYNNYGNNNYVYGPLYSTANNSNNKVVNKHISKNNEVKKHISKNNEVKKYEYNNSYTTVNTKPVKKTGYSTLPTKTQPIKKSKPVHSYNKPNKGTYNTPVKQKPMQTRTISKSTSRPVKQPVRTQQRKIQTKPIKKQPASIKTRKN